MLHFIGMISTPHALLKDHGKILLEDQITVIFSLPKSLTNSLTQILRSYQVNHQGPVVQSQIKLILDW